MKDKIQFGSSESGNWPIEFINVDRININAGNWEQGGRIGLAPNSVTQLKSLSSQLENSNFDLKAIYSFLLPASEFYDGVM